MKTETEATDVTRFLNAWFTVRQYIQASNFNRFQGAGLSATQFMTLNLLPADGSGVTIGELARRLNLAPATVTKTVDSLEARKMLARTRNGPDRRHVFVQITDAGLELQNSASGQFREQIGGLFRAMRPDERKGLIHGLESLLRVAGPEATPTHAPGAAAPAERSSKRSHRP